MLANAPGNSQSENYENDRKKSINLQDNYDTQTISDISALGAKPKKQKMGTLATFFAILKAYCAINVLLLPLSFSEGGYILSPCAMLIALFF